MTIGPAPEPPSTLRATWLITALALRRIRNRFSRFGKKSSAGERQGTARKRSFGGPIMLVLAVSLFFNGFIQSTGLVNRIALAAERRANPDIVMVDEHVMMVLDYVGTYLRAGSDSELEPIDLSLRKIAGRFLDRQIVRDDAERERRITAFVHAYLAHGKAGFRESHVPNIAVLPSSESWFPGNASREMLQPLGIVAVLVALALALMSTTSMNQDIAKVEWTFEWWFTFPVPARSLLLARALETAIANPLAWFIAFPFFTTVLICAGHGFLAVFQGLFATLYLGLLAGSLRVVMETGLRRYCSMPNVARIQALLSLVGTLALMSSALLVSAPDLMDPLVSFAKRLPEGVVLNALNPIRLVSPGALAPSLACLMFSIAVLAGATTMGGWFVRDGLTTSAGPHGGRPRTVAIRTRPRLPLGAIVRKEILLLAHDRKRLAQVFVSPVLLLGSQFVLNARWARAFASEPRHAASMAFVGTAIALTTGGTQTLAADAPALWIYFTVPRRIERLFAEQALFWAALVSPITIAVFIAIAPEHGFALFRHAPLVAYMLAGVVLQAFIVTALGVFGTDVLDNDPRRRVRVSMVYLASLLTGIFAYAVNSPSLWTKVAHLVLFALLAYSLWQKVSDHASTLLDPNELPAPRLAVADGVVAAFAFFILQGLFTFILTTAAFPLVVSLVFAFALAGLVVGGTALYVLHRSGIPDLGSTLGLCAPRKGPLGAIAAGVAAGIATGFLGKGYLLIVERLPMLNALRPQGGQLDTLGAGTLPWIVVLVTVAAPLFEEFIFRGLLYGGFRRSLGSWQAALASALVFAIVHPAVASPPVFVMGFVAALVYGRFGSLLAPILVHMTYNATVVAFALLT